MRSGAALLRPSHLSVQEQESRHQVHCNVQPQPIRCFYHATYTPHLSVQVQQAAPQPRPGLHRVSWRQRQGVAAQAQRTQRPDAGQGGERGLWVRVQGRGRILGARTRPRRPCEGVQKAGAGQGGEGGLRTTRQAGRTRNGVVGYGAGMGACAMVYSECYSWTEAAGRSWVRPQVGAGRRSRDDERSCPGAWLMLCGRDSP